MRTYDGSPVSPWPPTPEGATLEIADDARALAGQIGQALPLWAYVDRMLDSGMYRFFRYQDSNALEHASALRLRSALGGALGFTPPPALSGGYSLYQALPSPIQSQMTAYLSSYVDPAAAQRAVNQVANLGAAAFGTLQDLSSGNYGKAIGDASPIIAAALAATAANPIVGAAVLAAASILSLIVPNLGKVQTCDYKVGDVCFHQAARPSGPLDPDWVTIEAFDPIQGGNANSGQFGTVDVTRWEPMQGLALAPGGTWGALAFRSWWPLLGLELYALGDRSLPALDWAAAVGRTGQTSPDAYAQHYYLAPNSALLAQIGDKGRAFLIAFDHAFLKMQEIPLNGFTPLQTPIVIEAIRQAWNGGYAGPPTFSFPKSFAIDNGAPGADASKSGTFLQWILAGGYDGQSILAVDVNLGPKRVWTPSLAGQGAAPPSAGASAPSSSSSGTAVTVGLLAIAAVGLGWLALGRPLSIEAAKAAFRNIGKDDR